MKRQSGVLMHVSSLWGHYSEGSFGREAREWVDFLADAGFHVWQVLPFCLPDACNSPYKSFSAFSINPNFIDLPTLFEQGLLTEDELRGAEQAVPYTCEFERLAGERLSLLARAASRMCDRAPIDAFLAAHPQVASFCRFMAIKATNGGREWVDWDSDSEDEMVLQTWLPPMAGIEGLCQFARDIDCGRYPNLRRLRQLGRMGKSQAISTRSTQPPHRRGRRPTRLFLGRRAALGESAL